MESNTDRPQDRALPPAQPLPRGSLVKLGDTTMTVAAPREDIRGRHVVDRAGEEIGKVRDLLLDDKERKVRLIEVSGGGFLGIGDRTVLIPVDAIARIAEETVTIDRTRAHVAGSPSYDPKLQDDAGFWEEYYRYYGFSPFWASGYVYPPYPFMP